MRNYQIKAIIEILQKMRAKKNGLMNLTSMGLNPISHIKQATQIQILNVVVPRL